MLRPAAAYRRLAEGYPAVSAFASLRRPALAALVLGTAVAIGGTGRATVPLVVSTMLCWSFAVVWQLLAATVVLRSAATPLTFAQRLDLFFTGHAPWSLWLLVVAAWSRLLPELTDLYALLCTVAVPGIWTSVIVYRFCTDALALPQRSALVRVLLHQGLIWGFAFIYVSWAVALWARLVAPAAP